MSERNGITLIALIITIIVMLILVAVTISLAVNGGLFGYAGNAARDTELAKQEEQKIAEGEIEVDGKKYDSPEDFINGIESSPEKFSAIYEETREYIEDGETTAWIPKGFAVGISDGINSVSDGLVIRDKTGNEFVWIPVTVTGNSTAAQEASFDAIRTQKNNANYNEPATEDETEYNLMRTSIISKGGFYIARYEAGYSMTVGRTLEDSSTVVRPLSKKRAYPYSVVLWADAKSASQSMYNDSTKYGVKSTLCYGVQWDAMLDYIKTVKSTTSSGTYGNYKTSGPFEFSGAYFTSSDGWQNNLTSKRENTSMILQTGATDRNSVRNIYDVAGNVCEWTMEAFSSVSRRITRGGNGFEDATNHPAVSRKERLIASSYGTVIGFRVALYIV